MCEDTVEEEPNLLEFVSNHCKTQETCENVMEEEPWALQMSLIGLWHRSKKKYSMNTLTQVVMIMSSLRGTMAMNKSRLKK